MESKLPYPVERMNMLKEIRQFLLTLAYLVFLIGYDT